MSLLPRFSKMSLASLVIALSSVAAWGGGAGGVVGDRQEWCDLAELKAGLVLDIRYATKQNFTKEVLYPVAKAYLRRGPAEALLAVQRELQEQGLGLKIYDAYRPLPVQQKMWDLIRDERYVSNPAVNAGRHTRGASVDVTLVDRDGRELPMPTEFDDFTEKAHSEYAHLPAEPRAIGSACGR